MFLLLLRMLLLRSALYFVTNDVTKEWPNLIAAMSAIQCGLLAIVLAIVLVVHCTQRGYQASVCYRFTMRGQVSE